MSFRLPFSFRKNAEANDVPATSDAASEVSDGSLKYVFEQGGNDSSPSYQEATGAPVETDSPLGYQVGAVTIIFLNISKMIGTGIYSTRKKYLALHFLDSQCGQIRANPDPHEQRRASFAARVPSA